MKKLALLMVLCSIALTARAQITNEETARALINRGGKLTVTEEANLEIRTDGRKAQVAEAKELLLDKAKLEKRIKEIDERLKELNAGAEPRPMKGELGQSAPSWGTLGGTSVCCPCR